MLKNIEETKWPLKVLSEDKKEQNRKDLEVKMEELKLKFGKIAKILRAVADKLDQVWWNCKLADVGATTSTGILTIGCGIALCMTLGTAWPLLVGIALVGGGAVTNVGTSVYEAVKNSHEIKNANKLLQETFDGITEINMIFQHRLNREEKARLPYLYDLSKNLELDDHNDHFIDLLSITLEEQGMELDHEAYVSVAAKGIAKSVSTAGTKADVTGATRVFAQGIDDVKQAGTKAGSKAGGQLPSKVIIGVSAVFSMWDALDLGCTLKDLIENNGSDAAKILRTKADEVENLLYQMSNLTDKREF